MKGIDISSWQKGLVSLPVDFAIFKISEGRTWSDPCFDEFYELAKREGVPVGAYVFSYATTEEIARQEANKALSLLKGRYLPLGLYMDVESAEMLALSDSKLTAVVKAFCDTVRDAGYIAGAYGSSGQLWAKVGPSYVGDIIVWAASWGAKPSISCDLWQYTDNERISGYNGPVDGDEAMSERFIALVNGTPPVPAPAPAPTDDYIKIKMPVAKYGDKGNAVKLMQTLLIMKGCSCGWTGADGDFGPKAEGALVMFKSKNGLTGETCDPQTWSALLEV
jgi:GH25 family lysozyme M1 (1,4-beta-N-acetylmuramidase)